MASNTFQPDDVNSASRSAQITSSKRFMGPSGGPLSFSSSGHANAPASAGFAHQPGMSPLPANNSSSSNSVQYATRPTHQQQHRLTHGHAHTPSMTTATAPALPSRYLVTVLPPPQLPHDPPHPRTSTFCSGYGPPNKFRRGTLVPLHATLAGQVGAIAREYGLPSTGGIVLYLVELNQSSNELPQNPLNDALVGGPRIGEEAWQLLWGQLFYQQQLVAQQQQQKRQHTQPSLLSQHGDYDGQSFSEAEADHEVLDDEEEQSYEGTHGYADTHGVPHMAPLPPAMRHMYHQPGALQSSGADRMHSPPSEHPSDVSSLADNSSALASEELLPQHSMGSSNTSHIVSPNSTSMRFPKSSEVSLQNLHDGFPAYGPSSPSVRPLSSASAARGRLRNHPRGGGQFGRSSMLQHRQQLQHANTSRQSVRTNRSYAPSNSSIEGISGSSSNTSATGPIYGEAVIVGKIEFDIDNRRGAGKWFDGWMESANASPIGHAPAINAISGLDNRHSYASNAFVSPLAATPKSTTRQLSMASLAKDRPTSSNLGTLLRSSNLVSSTSNAPQDEVFAQNESTPAATDDESLMAPSTRESVTYDQGVLSGSEQADMLESRDRAYSQASMAPSVGHQEPIIHESEQAMGATEVLPDKQDVAPLELEATPQQVVLPLLSPVEAKVAEGMTEAEQVSQPSLQAPAQISPRQQPSSRLSQDSNTSDVSESEEAHREDIHSSGLLARSGLSRYDHVTSERSSSSSFGHEANVDAMNATPRVRTSQTFKTQSPSPTASSPISTARSPSASRSDGDLSTSSNRDSVPGRPHFERFTTALEDAAIQRESTPAADQVHAPRASLTVSDSSVYDSRRDSTVSSAYETGTAEHDVNAQAEASLPQRPVSSASSSRPSSGSLEAISIDQHENTYQRLEDGDMEHDYELRESEHVAEVLGQDQHSQSVTGPMASLESSNVIEQPMGTEDRDPSINEATGDALRNDPLQDIFTNDASTWAQIKAAQHPDDEEDSGRDSPSDGPVQTVQGLGISAAMASHSGHIIPPSASSSLDPFEYDDDAADTLNSPLGRPEDDLKEVAEMLKAGPSARHIGLSSPINLGEPALKRASAVDETDLERPASGVSAADIALPSSLASNSSSSPSEGASNSTVIAAGVALPDSESETSLAAMAPSASEQSIASLLSQPSITEPESDYGTLSRAQNRAGRLPVDWETQLSALGGFDSKKTSLISSLDSDEQGSNIGMPVGELPHFLTQLRADRSSSRASLASLKSEVARSRSSSIEMMDNLDEIERALAELSPRALRPGQDGSARNFQSMFDRSQPLETLPGYGKDSSAESRAPSTPTAPGVAIAENDLSEGHDDERSSSEGTDTGAARSNVNVDPSSPTPFTGVRENFDNEQIIAPPLPLKIRGDKTESAPKSPRDTDLRRPSSPHDYPGTPTANDFSGEGLPRKIMSPAQASVASTALPYDAADTTLSPPQKVTFGTNPAPEPSPALSKSTMASKFGGLKLKGWSGKNSTKEGSSSPRAQDFNDSGSPSFSEPAKSPMAGLKGLKFWHKDEHAADQMQKLAAEVALPMSPANSHTGPLPHEAHRPAGPATQPRIPRKSSLAGLAALARGESRSPNPQYAPPMPFPVMPAAAATPGSPAPGEVFPSPPTHTRLPSPPPRPMRLPSFMPSYPPEFQMPAGATSPGVRAGSGPMGASLNPPQFGSSSAMVASTSLPALSSTQPGSGADKFGSVQRTPDMSSLRQGRFMGHDGGQTTSAPATPAYAEPSLVSSSGRDGRPSKANVAKMNFRLSADADLSKMMSHMQAIEFGEDYQQSSLPPSNIDQGYVHPARAVESRNPGLGLGLGGNSSR